MPDLAATIAGEASVCPLASQIIIAFMVQAYGVSRFYGRSEPGPAQRYIAANLDTLPMPDPLPVYAFSREDMRQMRVRELTVGRRVETYRCKRGLRLNFVY